MNRVCTLAVTALSAAVIAGGVSLSTATSAAADSTSAAATLDADELSSEQIDNARTIIGVGKGADLSRQAQKTAVMTALQESSLLNSDSGDRDSAGLFQQRPSAGWGTIEQITDPVYAAKSFYGINPDSPNPGLPQIEDWEDREPGDTAQAVQRSAYPDAYAKWETVAAEVVADNQDVDDID